MQVVNSLPEPEPGSVVLLHGSTGTAYQHFFMDDRWHGTNGAVRTWQMLIESGPVLLIHDAQ